MRLTKRMLGGGRGCGHPGLGGRLGLGRAMEPGLDFGAHLDGIDLGIEEHREVAQHAVGQLEIALDLVHYGAGGGVIEANVIAPAFVVNPVGELAKTPFVGLEHLAAAGGDQTLETLDTVFDLAFAQIGAKDENGFVAPHAAASLWMPAPIGSKEQGATLTPADPALQGANPNKLTKMGIRRAACGEDSDTRGPRRR